MKSRVLVMLPLVVAALGLIGFGGIFASEHRAFRKAVMKWAERDLDARTALAASTLRIPIETGDFRTLHAFGDECTRKGVRVTVFSRRGGIVYDSRVGSVGVRLVRPEVEEAVRVGVGMAMRQSETLQEEFLYCARATGDSIVRLALPSDRVFAPIRRARSVFLLAGFTGGAGVFLIALVTHRQRMHLADLVRERDAQAKLVEEMKRVEAFRRDFIADVSHEIKTPLTGILGAVDLLQEEASLAAAERASLLDLLHQEATRLNGLAGELLALARLEQMQGGALQKKQEAKVAQLVESTVARLVPKAQSKGVVLHCEGAPDVSIECDPGLVEQALANLVENALRHSGAKEVWVSAKATEAQVVFSVEDHGCGIAEEEKERIFERFYRVDAARASDTGGSGLGLAIVRQIARLHGGDAWFEPATPQGAVFRVSLRRA